MLAGSSIRRVSFSDWLDAVWAHLCSLGGAMSNPFDFRDIMAANVGWIDKTVDQVIAEQEARDKRQENGESTALAPPTEAGATPVPQTEREKLDAIFARAAAVKQDQPPAAE